ncbi:hypothetical protein V500_05016 [Pseudogymnoascus sp. VKM F-4518 (FW-2643)]|nr:hypothetical protein V500_05016 [Pseudogymnoascus sp. VKM F-4518 (FW-2643)]
MRPHGLATLASIFTLSLYFTQGVTQEVPPGLSLQYASTAPGVAVTNGTKLCILPVGDSITVGWLGDDHNGYRKQLQSDLSADKVVFAGTERYGSMDDPYFATWSGKTIKYMHDNIDESLAQKPIVILLHAGINDMSPDSSVSTEGRDPVAAAKRLGALINKMLQKCPDATILVAMIISTTRPAQAPQTAQFQALVPGVVQTREALGKHVIAVDFTKFPTKLLRDGIHPTDGGYRTMGDWWYDFMTQIPRSWISVPEGPGPYPTGKLASGRGVNGDFKFHSKWESAGQVMPATGLDPKYTRYEHGDRLNDDMNGDGLDDYVAVNPGNGSADIY